MKTSAPGQLFGYTLQFPRALLVLLDAGENDKVVIEEFGDVSLHSPDGTITTEEDKSSLTGNALTDLSSNLWKTFYNWINAVNSGELNADRDHFILYTNHEVTKESLVHFFNDATEATVDTVVEKAIHILESVETGHGLFVYKETILGRHIDVFKKILNRFSLVVDRCADDVYPEIRSFLEIKTFIPKSEVAWVLNELTGWFQESIMTLIAKGQCACVSRKELQIRLQPLLEKIRTKELLDYAVKQIPSIDELSKRAGERPLYVKQLAHINLGEPKILEAVSDFFRADTNRLEWIEKGHVSEIDMEDFENKLVSFHANEQKTIELTQCSMMEENRGQLLLVNCQKRQETIAGKEPPDKTIQGSYHVLADESRLGWHPRWKDIINSESEGGSNGTTC